MTVMDSRVNGEATGIEIRLASLEHKFEERGRVIEAQNSVIDDLRRALHVMAMTALAVYDLTEGRLLSPSETNGGPPERDEVPTRWGKGFTVQNPSDGD